jgi:hypothetical protein
MQRQVARWKQTLASHRQAARTPADSVLARLRADPAAILTAADVHPDPWQDELLRASWERLLLCCSRQVGKSLVAGAIALRTALLQPRALVLILSASERQAKEFFQTNVVSLWHRLGKPVGGEDTATGLTLANRSRVLALPENERTVRVYSGVGLLVLDEASRVSDGLYYTVRPMLSVSRGKLIALSTPFGKRGFFYEEWTKGKAWERVSIKADQCPRITAEFLEEERRTLGDRWFRQEYCCSFEETIDSVFSHEDIMATLNDSVQPLFAQ